MSLPGSCTSCEAVNKTDDRFCGGCGTSLAEVVARTVVPPAIPSVPKRSPPPAPSKQRTMAIETMAELVLSEHAVEQPIG